MKQADVLIVGGGPAGAACAWKLRQQNVKVLILDKVSFPRTKLCAGWITPRVFELLETTPETYSFGITQFSAFQISIKKIHFTMPVRQYAIRRYEFDQWLLQRSGAAFRQHQVKEIQRKANQFIIDQTYSAPILIGAGGTFCPVRRTFFPNNKQRPGPHIVTLEEEFEYPFTDQRCHLWFFENKLPGYAWYVPKAGGWVNVGVGGNADNLQTQGKTIRDYWIILTQKTEQMGLVRNRKFSPRGHSYYLRHRSQKITQKNIYLIGDSAGLATRDMGEGIGPAIESGIRAGNAIIGKSNYSVDQIPRFSLPALLRRKIGN